MANDELVDIYQVWGKNPHTYPNLSQTPSIAVRKRFSIRWESLNSAVNTTAAFIF